MASGGYRFTPVISTNELAHVHFILDRAQEAKDRAEEVLRNIEVEYQTLRSADIPQGSAIARRFYGLHWQRHALQHFVREQTPVIENLYNLTNNVWTEQELLDEEKRDEDDTSDSDDAILVEQAPAA
jgi:hypothetical protein